MRDRTGSALIGAKGPEKGDKSDDVSSSHESSPPPETQAGNRAAALEAEWGLPKASSTSRSPSVSNSNSDDEATDNEREIMRAEEEEEEEDYGEEVNQPLPTTLTAGSRSALTNSKQPNCRSLRLGILPSETGCREASPSCARQEHATSRCKLVQRSGEADISTS